MTHLPPTRKPFTVAEAFPDGRWYTDVGRFHRLAHRYLKRVFQLAQQVTDAWPVPRDQSLKDSEIPPELGALTDERDAASDISRMFAAMSIEAFLNFYGAARLGEDDYETHFERLGIVPKTRQLLLICDSQNVSERDPLIKALKAVFTGRNDLVHPKAKKALIGDPPLKHWMPIPGTAKDAVDAMDAFFREFETLVPNAIHFTPALARD